jgi:hypothetical protein
MDVHKVPVLAPPESFHPLSVLTFPLQRLNKKLSYYKGKHNIICDKVIIQRSVAIQTLSPSIVIPQNMEYFFQAFHFSFCCVLYTAFYHMHSKRVRNGLIFSDLTEL